MHPLSVVLADPFNATRDSVTLLPMTSTIVDAPHDPRDEVGVATATWTMRCRLASVARWLWGWGSLGASRLS
jgi:hypothetical protein